MQQWTKASPLVIITIFLVFANLSSSAQSSMANIPGRNRISLNGLWKIIIDPYDAGISEWKAIWNDRKPQGKHDFYEYSFDEGPELKVPGDFNSQLPELNYYESTVWYKKTFRYHRQDDKRLFIHFGGINYKATVFLNNVKIGEHKGGFTAFQFEVTGMIKDGENSIIVRVNNERVKDGVPGLGFDWFNYGGITRDVNLVETPLSFIEDYFIQLQKGSGDQLVGWVKINGPQHAQVLKIEIPGAGISYQTNTDQQGRAGIRLTAKLNHWSPETPYLYKVRIVCGTDSITEDIGFRSIETKGTSILLNGKPIFLKGVNIHEEIPQAGRRAFSEADARQLLGWAKELGCNFVRLAHYPHNEYMVRLADKMGLMVWDEIPVYQGIDFKDPIVQQKMNTMLREMVQRDKNRCAVVIWSMSNETSASDERYRAIAGLVSLCRSLDSSRLISSATNVMNYHDSTASVEDSVINLFDVMAVNEYMGWYKTWPANPSHVVWESPFNKPLIMSEFGAEALYGNNREPKDAASSWSEDYQAQVYKDQIQMLKKIPFLSGTCPWILADFRSPVRMHPVFQKGWNRKGLISDKGLKKKAWYVMKEFYHNR